MILTRQTREENGVGSCCDEGSFLTISLSSQVWTKWDSTVQLDLERWVPNLDRCFPNPFIKIRLRFSFV